MQQTQDRNNRIQRSRLIKTELYKDDSELTPTLVEDRNYLYIATGKPETTALSGQWEVTVPFNQLDKTWKRVASLYPEDFFGITVVKCPTMGNFYQKHKGHHENFYKEVGKALGTVLFYVPDCTKIAGMKKSFASLNEAFPSAKIEFVAHEQMTTKRKSGFVFVDEMHKLKFSVPLYESFCKRNLAPIQELKSREKINFTNKYAKKYDFKELPEQFVVLDTETTGMDYVKGSVTEIGAVIVSKENLQVIGRFECLINIGAKLDPYITRLTGITDKLLQEKGQPAREVMNRLRAFVQGMPIIAHNARFDKGFVDMEFLKNGLRLLNNRWIDSIDIFYNHFPNRPSYALSALSHEFLEDFQQKHRAMADVLTVVDLLRRIPLNERSAQEKNALPS